MDCKESESGNEEDEYGDVPLSDDFPEHLPWKSTDSCSQWKADCEKRDCEEVEYEEVDGKEFEYD